jgi:hypothetical protein
MPVGAEGGGGVAVEEEAASAANPMETPILVMQAAALKLEETPTFIVNTRKHVIDSCRKNHANMSNDEKRKHAKVIDGLSKPYNTTSFRNGALWMHDSIQRQSNKMPPKNLTLSHAISRIVFWSSVTFHKKLLDIPPACPY